VRRPRPTPRPLESCRARGDEGRLSRSAVTSHPLAARAEHASPPLFATRRRAPVRAVDRPPPRRPARPRPYQQVVAPSECPEWTLEKVASRHPWDHMAKRLLCIYQHASTPEPGIYRHRLYLSELVRRGWHVDLISTPVNYMQGTVPVHYAHRASVPELIGGIHHHWVWALPELHRSRLHRATKYLSFAATASLRAATLPRPDVIWASFPPLPVGTLGELLSQRSRRRGSERSEICGRSPRSRSAGCATKRSCTGSSTAPRGATPLARTQ